MTDSAGPTGAARPPDSTRRIIPPGLRRLTAGACLVAALASTAGAASASTGAAPYSITEVGPAPSTGFSISDIGAVPTPGYHSPGTTGAPARAAEVGDINSR